MNTAIIPSLGRFSRCRRTSDAPSGRIGLCLSSGGARGLAHVGVIQVLEENNIKISAIAGTSMGAYVGSLWAAGFDGAKLEILAREIKDRRTLFRLLDPLIPPSAGLIKGDKIRKHLERSLTTMTFEDLKTPLIVAATDLDTLAPRFFNSGNVAAAVHASAAIPGVCAPVNLDGHRYTDGGASEPLPVSILCERFDIDHVIAVNVVPNTDDIIRCQGIQGIQTKRYPLRWLNLFAHGNVLDTFRRSLMAAQMQVAGKEAINASLVLHPVFCEARWYDFENFDRYIKAGRDAAIEALPQIRALASSTPPTLGGSHETNASNSGVGVLAA